MINFLLVDNYNNLHYYAKHLIGNDYDADDLTQETCLRILEKKELYNPKTPFFPWAKRVMKNLYLNFKRRGDFEDLPEDFELEDIGNRVEVEDEYEYLDIPENLRLVYFGILEGYTQKEIAQVLCIPEGTVKSRIYRLKCLLRKKIRPTT